MRHVTSTGLKDRDQSWNCAIPMCGRWSIEAEEDWQCIATQLGPKQRIIRDEPILLFSHLFFLLAILFSQPIMLNILLEAVICLKYSYIAIYLTVTSYTYIPKLHTNIIDSYSKTDNKC